MVSLMARSCVPVQGNPAERKPIRTRRSIGGELMMEIETEIDAEVRELTAIELDVVAGGLHGGGAEIDEKDNLAVGADYFFAVQVVALKFCRCCIQILDRNFYLLVCRYAQFLGRKLIAIRHVVSIREQKITL